MPLVWEVMEVVEEEARQLQGQTVVPAVPEVRRLAAAAAAAPEHTMGPLVAVVPVVPGRVEKLECGHFAEPVPTLQKYMEQKMKLSKQEISSQSILR
jgi:hypothetical protein